MFLLLFDHFLDIIVDLFTYAFFGVFTILYAGHGIIIDGKTAVFTVHLHITRKEFDFFPTLGAGLEDDRGPFEGYGTWAVIDDLHGYRLRVNTVYLKTGLVFLLRSIFLFASVLRLG